jgi:hypothetical protein
MAPFASAPAQPTNLFAQQNAWMQAQHQQQWMHMQQAGAPQPWQPPAYQSAQAIAMQQLSAKQLIDELIGHIDLTGMRERLERGVDAGVVLSSLQEPLSLLKSMKEPSEREGMLRGLREAVTVQGGAEHQANLRAALSYVLTSKNFDFQSYLPPGVKYTNAQVHQLLSDASTSHIPLHVLCEPLQLLQELADPTDRGEHYLEAMFNVTTETNPERLAQLNAAFDHALSRKNFDFQPYLPHGVSCSNADAHKFLSDARLFIAP